MTHTTQQTTHTPGPWECVTYGQPYDMCRVRKNGHDIAKVSGLNAYENEANAQLIAAAPEMLEALEELNNTLNNGVTLGIKPFSSFHTKMAGVINKAKGE